MMDILDFYTETLAANGFERPSDDVEKMAEERGEHPDRVKMAKAIYEQMILDGVVQEKYASSDAALQDAFEMADKYAEYVHQEVKQANALANGLLRVCKHAAEGFLAQHSIDDMAALEAVKVAGLQAESALEEEAVKAAESECPMGGPMRKREGPKKGEKDEKDDDDEKGDDDEKDASAGGEPPGKRATAEGLATPSVETEKVAEPIPYGAAAHGAIHYPTPRALLEKFPGATDASTAQALTSHADVPWTDLRGKDPGLFDKVTGSLAQAGRSVAGENASHLENYYSGVRPDELGKMTRSQAASGLGEFAKQQDPSILRAAKGIATKHPVATTAAIGIPVALGAMHVMKRKREKEEENRRRRLASMAGLPQA